MVKLHTQLHDEVWNTIRLATAYTPSPLIRIPDDDYPTWALEHYAKEASNFYAAQPEALSFRRILDRCDLGPTYPPALPATPKHTEKP